MPFKYYIIVTVMLLLGSISNNYGQRGKKSNASKLREAEFYFTEGQKYYILEDYAKALALFQKSLDIDPNNATVYYKIGQIHAEGNDTEKALENALKALKLNDKNKYFYVLVANLYTQMGDFPKAAEVYEDLIEKIDKTNIYLFELAALYLYQQRYDDAINTYNRMEKSYGISEEITSQKQKIYLKTNELDKAIEEGQKLIDFYPSEELYVVKQAEILLSNSRDEATKELLEKFLSNNPDAYQSRLMLAEIKRKNGLTNEALKDLKILFEHEDFNADRKVELLAQYRSAMSRSALDSIGVPLGEILVKAHPEVAETHVVYADILQQTGRSKKAKLEYSKAISKDPSNFGVWQNVIQLHFQMNEIDSAIYRSEMALELFPNQSMLYYFNGAANLQASNSEEAVYALEQGKKLSSANLSLVSAFNSMLGDAYNNIGDYDQSDKAYEAALDFDPTNDGVLNNYSYFLALRKEKLDKAEQMAKSVVDRNPENVTFLDTYAWVLYMKGKFKEAKKVMEKTLAIGDVSAIHYEHYGDILFKLGEIDEAVEQWQIAKGMNLDSELIDKKIADRKLYE